MSMTSENAAALLVDELRRDTELDSEPEADALARVWRELQLRRLPSSKAVGDAELRGEAASAVARGPKHFGARVGLLGALLVGTALGAGGHAVVSYVLLPAAAPATVALSLPKPQLRLPRVERPPAVAPAVNPPAATESMPVAAPAARSAKVAAAPLGLDAELRELERARRDVAGTPGQALRALDEQARRYPASVLRQEREALRLRALVGLGRFAEARAAAAQFRTRYPDSLLLDSVERVVASIP